MMETVEPKRARPAEGSMAGRARVVEVALFAAVGVSLAVVVGLARCLSEAIANHYVTSSFWSTIAAIAAERVGLAAILGLALGVTSSFFFRIAWQRQGYTSSISGVLPIMLRHPRLARWVLWCAPLVAATVIVVLSLSESVGRRYSGAVVAGIASLGLVVLATGWWARRQGVALTERASRAILGLWAAASLLVVGGLSLQHPYPTLPVTYDAFANHLLLAIAVMAFYGIVSAAAPVLPLSGRPVRLPRGVIVLALLPVLLAPASFLIEGNGLRPARPHNVVLIGIDTLRADRTALTGPGLPRDLTPALRRVASRGTVFSAAISQAPWTLPAFASILTGRYPREHGATSQSGFLREGETTLSEILREAGYATGSVVSQEFLKRNKGLVQGSVDHDERYALGDDAVTSPRVTDSAVDFLRRHAGTGKPYFLFVHYFDPHFKYRDHSEWDYVDGDSGWMKRIYLSDFFLNRHLLGAAEIASLRDHYDEEVAFTDREVGRLIDFLEREGELDDTAVIVVSDHGEEFMEHGWIGHTNGLYDELIRVPMIVALPGIPEAPGVVDQVVETRSLFPTVLEYLGVDFPSSAPSLLALLLPDARKDATEPHVAFSSVWLPDPPPTPTTLRARMTALRTNRWKLIVDHMRNSEELFDLENDPSESENLAAVEAETIALLRPLHDEWFTRTSGSPADRTERQLPAADLERLKALGYL